MLVQSETRKFALLLSCVENKKKVSAKVNWSKGEEMWWKIALVA